MLWLNVADTEYLPISRNGAETPSCVQTKHDQSRKTTKTARGGIVRADRSVITDNCLPPVAAIWMPVRDSRRLLSGGFNSGRERACHPPWCPDI